MKSLAIITLFTLGLSVFANAANNTVVVKGAKAQAVITSLLVSGTEANINGPIRSIQLDELSTVYGFAQHECDDEEALCGLTVPGSIQIATQKGHSIEMTEQVQLFQTLTKIVDPLMAGQHIENQDSAMGRLYTEYGQVHCQWTLTHTNGYTIKDAVCQFKVQSHQ